MRSIRLEFTRPAWPVSENEARRLHWSALRQRTKPWRLSAWAVARNAITMRRWPVAPVPITVQVVIPFSNIKRRRDPHNYTGTIVKAVCDGLTSAGIVPDDTAAWVTVLDSELTEGTTAAIIITERSTTP